MKYTNFQDFSLPIGNSNNFSRIKEDVFVCLFWKETECLRGEGGNGCALAALEWKRSSPGYAFSCQ